MFVCMRVERDENKDEDHAMTDNHCAVLHNYRYP